MNGGTGAGHGHDVEGGRSILLATGHREDLEGAREVEHLDLVEDQDGNGASHGVSCRQQAASHGSLLLDLRLARPEVELVDGDHQ